MTASDWLMHGPFQGIRENLAYIRFVIPMEEDRPATGMFRALLGRRSSAHCRACGRTEAVRRRCGDERFALQRSCRIIPETAVEGPGGRRDVEDEGKRGIALTLAREPHSAIATA